MRPPVSRALDRACYGTVLAAVLAGGLAHAQSKVLEAGGLTLQRDGDTCTLTVAPVPSPDAPYPVIELSAMAGADAPRQTATITARPGNPGSPLQAVIGDRRFDLGSPETFDITDQKLPPLLQALLQRQPIHLTERSAEGSYASVPLLQAQFSTALVAMQKTCGVRFDSLQNVGELFKEQEDGLALSAKDMRHITYVLHSQFGDASKTAPTVGDELSGPSRDLLAKYRARRKLPGARYLDRDAAETLKREKFDPIRLTYKGHPRFRQHRDWFTFTEERSGTKTCILSTIARTAKGAMVWRYPEMRILASAGSSGGRLGFDILRPKLLDMEERASDIRIDDWSAELAVMGRYVVPIKPSGKVDGGLVKALRKGRTIQVKGPVAEDGEVVQLEFSALGFSNGFKEIMKACDRPDLDRWLK